MLVAPANVSPQYGRIRDDPIVFDNSQQLFVDAVRKSFVEVKVNATPGLRMWTKCWGVLTENYDVSGAHRAAVVRFAHGRRLQRRRRMASGARAVSASSTCASRPPRVREGGGWPWLRLFTSLPCEDVVYLTFPLRRTVGLVEISKKEFCLVQSSGLGTTASSSSLRGVLGTPQCTSSLCYARVSSRPLTQVERRGPLSKRRLASSMALWMCSVFLLSLTSVAG